MTRRPEHAHLSIAKDLDDAAQVVLEAANRLSFVQSASMIRTYQRVLVIRNLYVDGKVPDQTARDIATSAVELAEAAINLDGYCRPVLPAPIWSRR